MIGSLIDEMTTALVFALGEWFFTLSDALRELWPRWAKCS
jgi:hypothetical protein